VIVVTKLLSASGLVYYPLDAGYLDVSKLKGARGAIDDGGPIYSAARTPLTYAFTDPDDGKDTLDPRETPTTLAKYLTVPLTIDSLVIRRAKTITSKCTSPWNKIEAICADLDSRHSYSQNYSAGPGDPVSDFILSKKPSYCEYFASAAVIMMRAVGIPARYVIGYYAHDHDNSGNTIVLQRDAHAWAEAYVNGTWITVDATPAGGRPDELYKPTLWQSISDTVADRIQMLRDRLTALGPVNIAVAAMLVIGVYFFVRIMLKELLSKRFKKTRSAGSRRFHSELGRRFANLLTKNKIVVPDGRTWLEYLKDAKELPIDRELALEFVDAYNQVRFGGMADNHLTEMLDMLEKTKK
jgi:transglutaminase-like putative cysteine protease